jgi:AraC-like DNA-binding protein
MMVHNQSFPDSDEIRSCGVGGRAAMHACTQRVGGFAKLPELIRAFGVDPARVLEAADLPGDALDDPDGRVSLEKTGRLLRVCVEQTHCPHFALLAGRLWWLADWGVIGELARHSPTVGQALQEINGHQHLASEGALTMLVNHGASVDFIHAMYVPRTGGSELVADAMLAAAFNLLGELCGPDWCASEVCMAHSANYPVGPYRSLFRATLRFDSEICALRFASHWLNRPIDGADPLRRRAAERLLAHAGRPDLVQEVYRTLRGTLLVGHKGGDLVAHNLSMHRRTLTRRLRAQGTTYQEALDEVRFAVASQLLGDARITLDDVAANLGYASVNTFMRAFARWTGRTPGSWRREHVPEPARLERERAGVAA